MKMIEVLSWLLAVIGGLQFALSGIGVNLLGNVFGNSHMTVLSMLIGVSMLYHGIPALKSHLAKL